jgi:SAM-dependent methyltransferase
LNDKPEIRSWWSENPMTYAQEHGRVAYDEGAYEFGDREFFERVDREFYSWNRPLQEARPFDRIFPYDQYAGKAVLEIGCGMGTMAMNWAQNGATMTAVDLNPVAVKQTTQRFALFGLDGTIRQSDANELPFADGAFDYAYSWGVLHHSPNLALSLSQMMRVLKPGGRFGLMLYNRRSLLHWYTTQYIEGYLHYEDKFLDELELASRSGDGGRQEGNPHTWPVTRKELLGILSAYSSDLDIDILGTDLDYVFRYLLPGLGLALPAWLKKPWARRFGWSLWASGTKS